jgi:hypothetical protein
MMWPMLSGVWAASSRVPVSLLTDEPTMIGLPQFLQQGCRSWMLTGVELLQCGQLTIGMIDLHKRE